MTSKQEIITDITLPNLKKKVDIRLKAIDKKLNKEFYEVGNYETEYKQDIRTKKWHCILDYEIDFVPSPSSGGNPYD